MKKTGHQELIDEMDKYDILLNVYKYISPTDELEHQLAQDFKKVNKHLSDFFEETGDEEDSERFDHKRKRRRR